MVFYLAKQTMHLSRINVLLLCVVIFTWGATTTGSIGEVKTTGGVIVAAQLTSQTGSNGPINVTESISTENVSGSTSIENVTGLAIIKNVTGSTSIENVTGSANTTKEQLSTLVGPDYFKAYVACRCGKRKRVWRKNIDIKIAEMYNNIKDNPKLGGLLKDHSFLTERHDCSKCTVHYTTCHGENETYYFNCIKRKISLTRILKMTNASEKKSKIMLKRSAFPRMSIEPIVEISNGRKVNRKSSAKSHPKIVDIPMGGVEVNGNRIRRSPGPCTLPRKMHSSTLKCIIYEDHVKCLQRCAWGHTLPSGITQLMECYMKNNTWMPHKFKECQAFVDCEADLHSPGVMNCSETTLTKGPTCRIGCERYEDKDAVPEDTYTCTLSGKWDKPFPFCAVRSNALVLVKPPKKKLHDDSEILF